MTPPKVNVVDASKLDRLLEIARSLHLVYSLNIVKNTLHVAFYLYEGDLKQYIELCRRLKGYDFSEEAIDDPMSAEENTPIMEITVKV